MKTPRTPIEIISELQAKKQVATYNVQVNESDIEAIQKEAFDAGYEQGRNAGWNNESCLTSVPPKTTPDA